MPVATLDREVGAGEPIVTVTLICAPSPVRVFDMAASLLLLSETGGVATTIEGEPIAKLRCDLESRSTLLCAPTAELHAEAMKIVRATR